MPVVAVSLPMTTWAPETGARVTRSATTTRVLPLGAAAKLVAVASVQDTPPTVAFKIGRAHV